MSLVKEDDFVGRPFGIFLKTNLHMIILEVCGGRDKVSLEYFFSDALEK